jgi:hypothetical protein
MTTQFPSAAPDESLVTPDNVKNLVDKLRGKKRRPGFGPPPGQMPNADLAPTVNGSIRSPDRFATNLLARRGPLPGNNPGISL